MLALKIILFALGAAFASFGYLIFFRKKHSLINGFERDLKSGRKNEEYAKRVGLVEFIVGTALLIAGVVLVILA